MWTPRRKKKASKGAKKIEWETGVAIARSSSTRRINCVPSPQPLSLRNEGCNSDKTRAAVTRSDFSSVLFLRDLGVNAIWLSFWFRRRHPVHDIAHSHILLFFAAFLVFPSRLCVEVLNCL